MRRVRPLESPAATTCGALIQPGGMGQCREQLHLIVILYQEGQELRPIYPTVPAEFPACSRHQTRQAALEIQ